VIAANPGWVPKENVMRSLLIRRILASLLAAGLAACAASGGTPVDRPDRPDTTTWRKGF